MEVRSSFMQNIAVRRLEPAQADPKTRLPADATAATAEFVRMNRSSQARLTAQLDDLLQELRNQPKAPDDIIVLRTKVD